jgi:hypothetical protein
MPAARNNKYAANPHLFKGALKRAIARSAKGSLRDGLDTLASVLVAKAAEGEAWALGMVMDRIDGKAIQPLAAQIEHTYTVTALDADTLRARLVESVAARASDDTAQDSVSLLS